MNTPEPIDWAALVAAIRAGDLAAEEELYEIFGRGIRFYLCRQLGAQDLDDKVHDTFVIVVQAIQRGDLREPQKLMGFVRTIVRRAVAGYIEAAVKARTVDVSIHNPGAIADSRIESPEDQAIAAERRDLIIRTLERMSSRDREILTRFYLCEQPPEQICEEMSLSDTQYRLLKSRAKARFGELGARALRPPLKKAA